MAALCLAGAISQFLTAIAAEGEFDLARHLFLYNLQIDALFVTVLFGGAVLWRGDGTETSPAGT